MNGLASLFDNSSKKAGLPSFCCTIVILSVAGPSPWVTRQQLAGVTGKVMVHREEQLFP